MTSSTPRQRVVLTGTSGVIGRKVVRLLLDAGWSVLSIDREPLPGDLDDLDVDHVKQDLSTMDLEPLNSFGADAVVHLAASFERSQESPGYWVTGWRDDVVASHRLLDVVRHSPTIRSVVFASSYLVYDPTQYLSGSPEGPSGRLAEDAPLLPRNLCGAGKLYTERELEFIRTTTRPDLRVVNARIFRAYGQGSRDVVSRWVRAGLRGEKVEVYNAENVFDYVYSGDIAQVLTELLKRQDVAGTFNVATGRGTSIREVVEALLAQGIVDPTDVVDRDASGPYESSVADVKALQAAIGMVPDTDIMRGVNLLAEHEAVV